MTVRERVRGRNVAGRRQSRFAECPARRAKGETIVSDGLRQRGKESDAVQLGVRVFAAKYDALDFCLALRADWLEFNTRLSPFSSILPLQQHMI